MSGLFAPIYTVRLRPDPENGDGVRGLKRFLKAALRCYGLRCLSATTEQFEIPGRVLAERRAAQSYPQPPKIRRLQWTKLALTD